MNYRVDLMGQIVYDLLYVFYDENGKLVENREDIDEYCAPADIAMRIKKLKPLLKEPANNAEYEILLEVAMFLAEVGVVNAVDWLNFCIDYHAKNEVFLYPDRLRSYDNTYLHIQNALSTYYAVQSEKSDQSGLESINKLVPIYKKLIRLSSELPFQISTILRNCKMPEFDNKDHYNLGWVKNIKYWRILESDLRDHLHCLLSSTNKNGEPEIHQRKIEEVTKLLAEWD